MIPVTVFLKPALVVRLAKTIVHITIICPKFEKTSS
jgi:hypothetical protein